MTGGNGAGPAPAFEPIAIIGMRGRFPGANDLETFWENLAGGVESITTLSREEMRAAGVADEITRLPGYVNAAPLLDGVDQFDAEFFGFSARDAALTDPQHRLFLETTLGGARGRRLRPGDVPRPDRPLRRLRAQHLPLSALPEPRERSATSTACS